MKWAITNAVGAVAWVLGLSIAKGSQLATGGLLPTPDHQVFVGSMCGIAGLAILLWVNLRSTT